MTPTKLVPQGRQGQSNKSTSVKYNPPEDSENGFPIEPPGANYRNGITHSSSVIHPNAASAYTWTHKVQKDAGQTSAGRNYGSSHRGVVLLRQGPQMAQHVTELSSISRDGRASSRDTKVYAPTRSRILCSGPLVPAGRNIEEMLEERERHIQEAVRKARLDKVQTK